MEQRTNLNEKYILNYTCIKGKTATITALYEHIADNNYTIN